MGAWNMPNGLTLKQERFAQAYVANGGNASAAYRDSYDANSMNANSIGIEASDLLAHPYVAPRIVALEAQGLAASGTSPEWVLAGLVDVASKAKDAKQFAAANRSYELVGKHAGMFKDDTPTDHRHLHVHVTADGVRDARLTEFSTEEPFGHRVAD